VINNDQRAQVWSKIIVFINVVGLIFDKIFGFRDFADVMIIGANTSL